MTKLEIIGGDLIVRIQGWERLWSLRRTVRISLGQITAVSETDEVFKRRLLLRVMGTSFPGFRAGLFWSRRDGLMFWDVRGDTHAIAITLHDSRLRKVLIDVEDPDAAIAMLHRVVPPGRQ
jgi:hypothetical protein